MPQALTDHLRINPGDEQQGGVGVPQVMEAKLWMKDENYFKNLRSTLGRGKEVIQVLPEKRQVIYCDGSSENYDTLLIASGSEPIKPPIKGLEEVGVQGY